MRYLTLHLFPSELIRSLHGCFAWSDQILNNLRREVEAELFHEQRIPDNPWWKNCSSSKSVNKLSYLEAKK